MQFLDRAKNWFLAKSLFTKMILIGIILFVCWFGWTRLHSSTTSKPTYQTEQAATGTLVTSISASGIVTAGAASTITTTANAVVQHVYVKNGDSVNARQNISTLSLHK